MSFEQIERLTPHQAQNICFRDEDAPKYVEPPRTRKVTPKDAFYLYWKEQGWLKEDIDRKWKLATFENWRAQAKAKGLPVTEEALEQRWIDTAEGSKTTFS